MWKTFFNIILDLFFPIKCINCQRPGNYLCKDCLSLVEISKDQYCPFCFPPKIGGEGKTCSICKKTKYLDGLWVAASFQNPIVKKAIHLFKYPPFIEELAKPLSFLIIAHFNLLNNKPKLSDFILVPVPLHPKRRTFRGFNQAELLAKELSRVLNIPVKNLLIKTKRTQLQVELTKSKREKNVFGVFEINSKMLESVTGKKILLVDDVFTTGSTMNEAARILKKNGAKEVWGVVVAREPLGESDQVIE
jgi:ComF family protein